MPPISEVHSPSESQILREQNTRTLQAAIQALLPRVSRLEEEIVSDLDELMFPQTKPELAQIPLQLTLSLKEIEPESHIGLFELSVVVRSKLDDKQIAAHVISFSIQPDTEAFKDEYHSLVHANEVVLISSVVKIEDARYESLGIGSALLLQKIELINVGIRVLQLAHKKLILSYIWDTARGADRNRTDEYRTGWSTQVGARPELGYSSEVAEKYFSDQFLWQLDGLEHVAAKVISPT